MLAEITAGLGSLKTAIDILKGLNAAHTNAAINDVKLALQQHLFDAREALTTAQSAQSAALQRISELEQEIVQLKDWEGEKQRYQLKAIDIGSVAYMPKPGMENGEQPHWLCANCFNRGQKSHLQFKGQDRSPGGGTRGMQSTYGCDNCKSTLRVFFQRNPLKPWAP